MSWGDFGKDKFLQNGMDSLQIYGLFKRMLALDAVLNTNKSCSVFIKP